MGKLLDIHNETSGATTVYVYGVIGEDTLWSDVDAKQLSKEIDEIDADQITVRVHSPGGSVYSGFAIYNALKRHKAEVTTVNDGIAASMGSIVMLAGDNREAATNSVTMIHNAWGGAMGYAEDLERAAKTVRKLSGMALDLYESELNEDREVIEMFMNEETLFTAKEAKELGFVSALTDEKEPDESMLMTEQQMKMYNIPMLAAAMWIKPGQMELPELPEGKKPELKARASKPAVAEIKEETPMSEQEKAALEKANQDAIKAAVKEATEVETARMSAVEAELSRHDAKLDAKVVADIRAEALADTTIDANAICKMVLDRMSEDDAPGAPAVIINKTEGGADAMQKMLNAYATGKVDEQEDNPYKSYGSMDFAREWMKMNNISDAGMGTLEIANLVVKDHRMQHSTTDFSKMVAASANVAIVNAYKSYESNIQRIAGTGTVANLKKQEAATVGRFSPLLKVPEGDEYVYGTLSTSQEAIQISKYGRKFNLTEESVINDEILDILSLIPQAMGREAFKTEERLILERLLNNTMLMSDGFPLFNLTEHNNDHAGTPLDADGLSKVEEALLLQKDTDGNVLGATPKYLMVPAALKNTAIQLVGSAAPVGATNAGVINVFQNAMQVIVAPELDAVSKTTWYVISDPADAPGLQLTGLRGYPNPQVQSAEMADIDGTEYKVRHFVAGSALGYQGIQRASA